MGFEKCLTVNNKVEKYKSCLVRTIRKLNSLTSLHAGFLVCFVYVPFMDCTSLDTFRRFGHENIYNYTHYVQIQESTESANNFNYSFNEFEDSKDNNSEEYRFRDKFDVSNKSQLLVGSAHGLFGFSITEKAYLKGVRENDLLKTHSNKGHRSKRDLMNLYMVISCSTVCDPWLYDGYGCYCGMGGSGTPVDAIDRCCQLHDKCYAKTGCLGPSNYVASYKWQCSLGAPLCSIPLSFYDYNYNNKRCGAFLCECDRQFAICLARLPCPRKKPWCTSSLRRAFVQFFFP